MANVTHPTVVLRLTVTTSNLHIDRPVRWSDRVTALRHLEKACIQINNHVDFEALTAELVES